MIFTGNAFFDGRRLFRSTKFQRDTIAITAVRAKFGVTKKQGARLEAMAVGPALWLESYVAGLAAILPGAVLALRSILEQRFLKRELKGYEAYTEKVRYRLIPFVW